MTLLEKIEAYVASQGNQVGGGSEFADLLKEIVNSIPQGGNEPLIVEGHIATEGTPNYSHFIPNNNTISFEEAKNAFLSGRTVILKADSVENPDWENVKSFAAKVIDYAGNPEAYGYGLGAIVLSTSEETYSLTDHYTLWKES